MEWKYFMEQTRTNEMKDEYGTASGVRRALAASLMETEDARGRRTDSTFDDLARPTENARATGATTKSPSLAEQGTPSPERTTDAKAKPRGKWNSIPLWGWWVGGSAMILAVCLLLFFLVSKDPGFTLIVR